jgi:hypothetical protein
MNKSQRPNKINTASVLLLLLLMPLLLPLYLLSGLVGLIAVVCYCGYKSSQSYFIDGLGYETEEQIFNRMLKERGL